MTRTRQDILRTCALALTLATPAALTGCSGETETNAPADAGVVAVDAGEPDAGMEVDAGPVCGDPGEPYGTSEGSRFSPFTFQDCDGNDYTFYGETEGYCEASYTVLVMAAGWCGPCRLEAEMMQELLVEPYAADGVRFIVALVQDDDYRVPDANFCNSWKAQYELTNPVLLDPLQETQVYFPGGALPASLIVDSEGTIVHREYGVSQDLQTIRARLDELLGK